MMKKTTSEFTDTTSRRVRIGKYNLVGTANYKLRRSGRYRTIRPKAIEVIRNYNGILSDWQNENTVKFEKMQSQAEADTETLLEIQREQIKDLQDEYVYRINEVYLASDIVRAQTSQSALLLLSQKSANFIGDPSLLDPLQAVINQIKEEYTIAQANLLETHKKEIETQTESFRQRYIDLMKESRDSILGIISIATDKIREL